MLKEKERVVYNFLAILDSIIAWLALDVAFYLYFGQFTFLSNKDSIILHLVVLGLWFLLSKAFRTNEIYRSRPFSILLFNVIGMTIVGVGALALAVFMFNLHYIGVTPLIYFGAVSATFLFVLKVVFFSYLKSARRRGLNYRNILIVGDESAITFVKQVLKYKEWGYRIIGVVGNEELHERIGDLVPLLPEDADVDKLIEDKTIDEVIYCREKAKMEEIMALLTSCNELGVVFRMSSPFFNMLTNKTHLHYFDTTPVLTISNTPVDYLLLKLKSVFDFVSSFLVITIFSPLFIGIAIGIKLSSKGPIFFKQKRVGMRGRKFWVYKYRTMVTNAEDLKASLMEQNEMDGPVFKIEKDPRITGIGHFLRKTSLDELPQFFNVLLGDMSIVGPRPPVPAEVREYERWQLRRLSMKPGITCVWQISPSRNDVSFEEWMRMDLEYIDNWSLRLDFVIILKTIRTMLRADGR
ncbi:sugar transferase [Carboxylicivirga sediminis]|uniref:Sugar transferase n=1 Tax=Carboxylicivirga sediminis TaxID=2006564 RepID=A0A941F796_9BACT|nr:sugar transferase [Carboxylicivirga sediminis]MBR8537907.1 sugar transferase [Carboxylicivirga sediminis]